MNSVFYLVLRRMRAPIIALITFYAIAVLGLTLVPGVSEDGTRAPPLSFFHAFYFISYTATTIGFGEIPVTFSNAQRMWVTVCIYMTVVSWSYSILTLLALLQDKAFQNTLVASRFARRVARMQSSFFIVCGCGETGGLICRALDVMGHDFVILEKNETRVEELDLEDFKTNDPALAADAALPSNLLMAGLRHRKCRGVLAVTDNEDANLAIAINVRLLNPDIPVLARARTPIVSANMASFGTHHIINGYERFAEYLALAASLPDRFRLIEILTALPGMPMPEVHRPPQAKWLICGYGHFGQAVAKYLALPGIDLTVIDSDSNGLTDSRVIIGTGTDANVLMKAGIMEASGIVVGSDDDVVNLSIAMMAKHLNPDIFIVVRQNQGANDLLFDTFGADFSMVHTRVVAEECIAILTTPLLSRFLDTVRSTDESWCRNLATRLEHTCGGLVPDIWDITLKKEISPALHDALVEGQTISIGQLLRDNADWEVPLPAIVLMLEREGHYILLPDKEVTLKPHDSILVAGQRYAQSVMDLTSKNMNALSYVLTGEDSRGGWLWKRLFASRKIQAK
jgi:Trk K+ transport system NAD-binding subunit